MLHHLSVQHDLNAEGIAPFAVACEDDSFLSHFLTFANAPISGRTDDLEFLTSQIQNESHPPQRDLLIHTTLIFGCQIPAQSVLDSISQPALLHP